MFCRRAFSVVGPVAWNSLPDYLRDPSRSVDSFCRDLKTFLFSFYSVHSALGGFAVMHCINLLLTLTLILTSHHSYTSSVPPALKMIINDFFGC